jgi:hypothetical protein
VHAAQYWGEKETGTGRVGYKGFMCVGVVGGCG